jgi:hypothetical protein
MNLATAPLMKPTLSLLLAQSRVLRALAGGAVLQGTPDDLIRDLDVGPEAFRAALHDLVEGGWIFTSTTPDGRLIVGRERRQRSDGPPGRAERRAVVSLWEGAGASYPV